MDFRFLDSLQDENLEKLNELLPWAAFLEDSHGRRFGKAFSKEKRRFPSKLPDPRTVRLHERFDLSDKSVLEIGCLDGIHTLGLASLARSVTAVDARIENVIKTLVRLWTFDSLDKTNLLLWNVEEQPRDRDELRCDILHHIGVLYHLVDPVRHLAELLPLVNRAVMLDTHVSTEESANEEYESNGQSFRYLRAEEPVRRKETPFAGMYDHAKWLLEEDLIAILKQNQFENVEIVQRRDERNGLRINLIAERTQDPDPESNGGGTEYESSE